MATTIKGLMSRQQICDMFGISIWTLQRRMAYHFQNRFKGKRLFTPKEVAEIAEMLDLWEVTIPD